MGRLRLRKHIQPVGLLENYVVGGRCPPQLLVLSLVAEEDIPAGPQRVMPWPWERFTAVMVWVPICLATRVDPPRRDGDVSVALP